MTWKQLPERDCKEWKLQAIDPHNRHTWISGVRSACSKPATWKGAPDVNAAPVPAPLGCTLIKNLMMMMTMMMMMMILHPCLHQWASPISRLEEPISETKG